ncbi:hypothetical protein METBIDRAFT_44111 [Metschnikowia bicuspidata var. bicuspidata NRRL YB-4993]|uniref:Uncharacterized protein n=1 Tax=Metschnikowia bicuspidata var. bicuspidata NRRL YB-4993 TaxID=869754 RepID=A0A1A0H9N0_9ASCO|nr:hypothetical protein METBIDRAFT_44111 [Metschnikowia bicuspidata var. bicuspidata NRRL YB-4993]OBA20721.1 hypothetical protein METBIDRAFT_44111 [Metschnikowia bicuspidata var. bicuspidata NRRL YB-4993]
MKNPFSSAPKKELPSDEPPPYEQLEAIHSPEKGDQKVPEAPLYSETYGPNEYPPEKGGPPVAPRPDWQNGNTSSPGHVPPGTYTYTVAPQTANIAYDIEGRNARPGYAQYLQTDAQRIAQGDAPKPREAFGRGGAPLAPSKKSLGQSGGFPGALGPTYYDSSRK